MATPTARLIQSTALKVYFLSVRLSPSDADSLGSDQSSARESAEESTRAVATPTEGKQHRKTPKNGQKTWGVCVFVHVCVFYSF